MFRNALEIDPELARAYVGLAYIYVYRIDFGLGTSVADNLTKLMDAARNAVQLDPNDGETQLVLGHTFAYRRMADQALEQFAKAEALAPNNADLLINIAWFLPQLGQPDRALELTEKALKLNPNYPYWYNQGLRLVYFFGRQFDKSVKYSNSSPTLLQRTTHIWLWQAPWRAIWPGPRSPPRRWFAWIPIGVSRNI